MKSISLPFKFILKLMLVSAWFGVCDAQELDGIVSNDCFITDLNLKIGDYKFLALDSLDSNSTNGVNNEPIRFINQSDKLLLNTGVLVKSYVISVENVANGKKLLLNPTGSVNIGFGANYKWLGIAFSFGIPTSTEDEKLHGETKKQDFQLNLYTNSFVFQGHLQRYKGFHVSEVEAQGDSKTDNFDKNPIVPSLETYSVGLSSWYFFNHKKFSYKAAYVRNAIQTKSAGSIVGGLYYSLDLANTDSPISANLPDSIKVDFNINGYRSRSFGISAGYSYTLVMKKKFFINATLVPGLGLKNVSLYTEKESSTIKDGFTSRLAFNFSMGYEAKHFLLGLRAFTSSRFFEINGFRITPTTNYVMLFVGKRFNIKRNKKS